LCCSNPMILLNSQPCIAGRRASYKKHGKLNLSTLPPHRVINFLQSLHDHRLVWPFEIQRQTSLDRNFCQLGYRLFRILPPGPGQSLGQRRLFRHATKNHPGNHHPSGLLRLRNAVPWGKDSVEPSGGFCLRVSSRSVHVPAEELNSIAWRLRY